MIMWDLNSVVFMSFTIITFQAPEMCYFLLALNREISTVFCYREVFRSDSANTSNTLYTQNDREKMFFLLMISYTM